MSTEEYDVTRRQFFNRGIYGVFGLFLAQFGIASLAFMWPRLPQRWFRQQGQRRAARLDPRRHLFSDDGTGAAVLRARGPVLRAALQRQPGRVVLRRVCRSSPAV